MTSSPQYDSFTGMADGIAELLEMLIAHPFLSRVSWFCALAGCKLTTHLSSFFLTKLLSSFFLPHQHTSLLITSYYTCSYMAPRMD
jgi:hypothetical protein